MSCPSMTILRNEMVASIKESCNGIGREVINSTDNLFAMFLGKRNIEYAENVNWELLCIIAKYVYQIYRGFIKQRDVVG